jgi:hypothetical protein
MRFDHNPLFERHSAADTRVSSRLVAPTDPIKEFGFSLLKRGKVRAVFTLFLVRCEVEPVSKLNDRYLQHGGDQLVW